ncbi:MULTISPECIES: hypothetical protein [Thalassospira]|jgi:hypothetical protein|uniref:hypothetical protein n=1 Tax=Thalassospira TaxID=168934 RepID=UPI000A7B9F94|nr:MULTISPECIES: hypothetical protein [Thalassospira]MCD1593111.1 hypothetical protein [Thalassospira xiamenensis]MDM7975241.1 hypothetical protein [Thalassospira xiamenensis]PXX36282.1 hypothetical protein C7967_101675 [Thalassospira sp. 11-3]
MQTPVPRILLALDGRIDFLRKSNGVDDEPETRQPSKDEVADKLRAALRGWKPSRR